MSKETYEYKYKWCKDARFTTLDPEKVGNIIEKSGGIEDSDTPRTIVAEAKNSKHYLHGVLYDKSDKKIALEYRLQLCRTMISSLEVVKVYQEVITGKDEPKKLVVHEYEKVKNPGIRAFVSDYNGHYQTTKTEEGRQALINQIRKRLINIRDENREFEDEFEGVFAAIDEMRAEWEAENSEELA